MRKSISTAVALMIVVFMFSIAIPSLAEAVNDSMNNRNVYITSMPKGAEAIIGDAGIISAIKGNQVTLHARSNSKRTVTVQVKDASPLKIGDHVVIKGNVLGKIGVTTAGDGTKFKPGNKVAVSQNSIAAKLPASQKTSNIGGSSPSSPSGPKDSPRGPDKDPGGGSGGGDSGGDKDKDPSGPRPAPEERVARSSQIMNASKNINAIIGSQAKISAIRGNQVTMGHLSDATKTVTVEVNDASMFKVGQLVHVRGNMLMSGTMAPTQKLSPSSMQAR